MSVHLESASVTDAAGRLKKSREEETHGQGRCAQQTGKDLERVQRQDKAEE
jgi:hypothetical protein